MDYVKADNLTEEDVRGMFGEFSSLEGKGGELFPFDAFVESVGNYHLLDCDGCGYLVVDGKIVGDSDTCCVMDCIYFRDQAYISFGTLMRLFGAERLGILWFRD